MEVLILFFIVVVVGGILSAEAKARARRIEEAYAFDPAKRMAAQGLPITRT